MAGGDTRPESTSPQAPDRLTQWALLFAAVLWPLVGAVLLTLPRIPDATLGVPDVVLHAFVFFWTAVAVWALLVRRGWLVLALSALTLMAMALASEVIQKLFVSGRDASYEDVAADLVGIGLAAIVFYRLVSRQGGVRARRLVAITTLPVLTVFAAASAFGHISETVWWICREGALTGTAAAKGDPLAQIDSERGVFAVGEDQFELTDPVVSHRFRRLGCAVRDSNELTVEVVFRSNDAEQGGPARIITYSKGTTRQDANFHIGQSGPDLSIRLRLDTAGYETIEVPDVIRPGRTQTAVVRITAGQLDVWVDSRLALTTQLPTESLEGWDPYFALVIGDELGGGRPFDGDVLGAELYARAQPDDSLAG
ncbi:MAG: hypothetical protein GY724_30115 [Actinomycetia bacterium]|nr:hypothetical protein [Actinomycetes bacterium]